MGHIILPGSNEASVPPGHIKVPEGNLPLRLPFRSEAGIVAEASYSEEPRVGVIIGAGKYNLPAGALDLIFVKDEAGLWFFKRDQKWEERKRREAQRAQATELARAQREQQAQAVVHQMLANARASRPATLDPQNKVARKAARKAERKARRRSRR